MLNIDLERAEDRRRFPRITNPSLVYVTPCVGGWEEGETSTAILHDISQGGLSFVTEGLYAPDETLNVEVRLALGAAHFFKAIVLRSDPMDGMNLVAVSYVDLAQEHLQALQESLSYQ